jgi:hypothetical protein
MPIIISNNLQGKMPIPEDAVIRVNLAWFDNWQEAKQIIDNIEHYVYLDFPSGRTKPPKPKIKLEEAIELSKLNNVKYFAISNAEDIYELSEIMSLVNCEVVPKIETETGVNNINSMIEDIGIKTIMLDKEDLYTNCKMDSEKYNKLVMKAREYGSRIKVLELQGVIFI